VSAKGGVFGGGKNAPPLLLNHIHFKVKRALKKKLKTTPPTFGDKNLRKGRLILCYSLWISAGGVEDVEPPNKKAAKEIFFCRRWKKNRTKKEGGQQSGEMEGTLRGGGKKRGGLKQNFLFFFVKGIPKHNRRFSRFRVVGALLGLQKKICGKLFFFVLTFKKCPGG